MPRSRKISVKIDSSVYAAAAATLKARGIGLNTWLTLQLRAFACASKPIVGLADKMPFGKYYGDTVENVVRGDLAYATWMLDHWPDRYTSEVHELANELNGV